VLGQPGRTLAQVLRERGLSLRRIADTSGVNRQAVADLIEGRSWPDIATVARLGDALATSLWPQMPGGGRRMGHEASIPARTRTSVDRA